MALYKCPVCGKKGILTIRGDFYEWAASIFGQFHTYEERSLLPLLCHNHQHEAGNPNTLKEVQAFVDKKLGRSSAKLGKPSTQNSAAKRLKDVTQELQAEVQAFVDKKKAATEYDRKVPSKADLDYEKSKPKPPKHNPLEYMLKQYENETPIPASTPAASQQVKKKEAPRESNRNPAFLAWAKRQIKRG